MLRVGIVSIVFLFHPLLHPSLSMSPSLSPRLAPSPVVDCSCLSLGTAQPGGEKKWHSLLLWLSLHLRQALCPWIGQELGGGFLSGPVPLPTALGNL